MSANYFSPGDYNVTCQRTGFKVKASTTTKQWNNLVVRSESWEPRHPQDYIRSKQDQPGIRDARPRPDIKYLSATEVSASDL